MMFPLYTQDAIGYEVALVLYALVGVGFGFALERAGFGSAPNLVAQFYGTDTRVLKVMFTAIVTACVGLALLSSAGIVDLAAVQVPTTYLWPHLVGGLILGVGFIVSGYCPGTSVVAAASGKWDGLMTLAGVALGSLLYGLVHPAIADFSNAGDLGVLRWTDLLGLPDAVLAVAVLGMAVGAFLLGEHAERFFSRRRGMDAPRGRASTRNAILSSLGAVTALALVLTFVVERGDGKAPSPTPILMTPERLATVLIEDPRSVWVVDLRDAAACQKERIPGAVCRTSEDTDLRMIRDLPPTRTLVLYGDGDGTTWPEAASTYRGPIAVLSGGFPAFAQRYLSPPDDSLARTDPVEYRRRSAIHSFMTGAAAAPPPPPPSPSKMQPGKKKGGGC